MANLQLYTKAVVYVDGSLMSEEASVSIARASGSSPVRTVHKGYAGESPGSPSTEITVRSMVPAAAFEFDPGDSVNELQERTLTIFAAGSTLTVKGFIVSDNFSSAVDSESNLEFTFRAGQSVWE